MGNPWIAHASVQLSARRAFSFPFFIPSSGFHLVSVISLPQKGVKHFLPFFHFLFCLYSHVPIEVGWGMVALLAEELKMWSLDKSIRIPFF